MSIITPAILATNPDEYKAQVEAIFPFAERVHIDVTDGSFAPNLTLPETQIWWPQEWKVDIHMMVQLFQKLSRPQFRQLSIF